MPLSPTMAITSRTAELRARGVKIASLAAGEPAFDTPGEIVAAMAKAAEAGQTRYPPLRGLPPLRQAVAARFSERYGIQFNSNNILVTQGGKQAIFAALTALVGVGDEVLVPTPWWVSYPGQLAFLGARAVPVPMTPGLHRWSLSDAALEAAITPRTRGLIINSPHNPTGWTITPPEAASIARFAEAHDLWVMCDDVYVGLELDGRAPETLLGLEPTLAARAIIVDSVSKRYAMTGWRVGFLGGPPALIEQAAAWLSQTCSGIAPFAQVGALEALKRADDAPEAWARHYADNLDTLMRAIHTLGWSALRPEGAFYVFLGLPDDLGDDTAFATTLLEDFHVATVPGVGFGMPGYLRLSFACDAGELARGIDGLIRAAAARRRTEL